MILNIYVALVLLSYIIRKVFKLKPSGVLSCNLFAYCGAQAPEMDKIKILGIIGEERGVHSCGYFYNGEVKKGVEKESLFRDFIGKNFITPVEGGNVFIGHNRQATYGQKTIGNAHPFLINDRMVIAHNGTIPNIWDLCRKHGINSEDIYVDSLALGCIIDKDGYGVLEEYKGGAALLIHTLDKPNVLKIYHGASRDKENGEELEERPLFYLRSKGGIYFSSLAKALYAIRDSDKYSVEIVPYNLVITISSGKVMHEKISINRGNCNVPVKYVYIPPAQQQISNTVSNSKKDIKSLVWEETIPPRVDACNDELVFFWKGRYWESVVIDRKWTEKLVHGLRYLDKKTGKLVTSGGEEFWFWRGAMLRNQICFENLSKDPELIGAKGVTSMVSNYASKLSRYSKYPVTNWELESIKLDAEFRFAWYRDGRICQSGFTAKFSNRNYILNKEGFLTNIKSNDKDDYPFEIEETIDMDKNEENLSTLEVEMKFFEKDNWTSASEIRNAISDIGLRALKAYIVDGTWKTYHKALTDNDVSYMIDKLFTEIVKERLSISDAMEQTGELKDFIEDEIEREIASADKEIVKELPPPAPVQNTIQPPLFEDVNDYEEIPFLEDNSEEEAKKKSVDESAKNVLIDRVAPAVKELEKASDQLGELYQSAIAVESFRIIDNNVHNMVKQLLDVSETYKSTEIRNEFRTSKTISGL